MIPITDLESQNIQNNNRNQGGKYQKYFAGIQNKISPGTPKFDINLGVITGLMLIAGVFGFLPLVMITLVDCVISGSLMPSDEIPWFIFDITWLIATGIFVLILETRSKHRKNSQLFIKK